MGSLIPSPRGDGLGMRLSQFSLSPDSPIRINNDVIDMIYVMDQVFSLNFYVLAISNQKLTDGLGLALVPGSPHARARKVGGAWE